MITYAEKDQVSAIRDLIAFDGELIHIGGEPIRAHVVVGEISQEAEEHGLHNREEEMTATIINREGIDFNNSALRKGKHYRITGIDSQGEQVSTLSLVYP
jgi:hypothetical protein